MSLKTRRFGLAGSLAVVALVAAAVASTGSPASWSYQGATGPSHWGDLDPSFTACVDGTKQSPINITPSTAKKADLLNIVFNYHNVVTGVFNNGHTVEAEPLPGEADSNIYIGQKSYALLQMHFHAPSEHAINGMHYPAEVHFVNKLDATHLAVVGVFIKQGEDTNAAWGPFLDAMAGASADPEETQIDLDWSALLPNNRVTYRYNGSLTTPGCAEIVKWNVMKTPVVLSADQIQQLIDMYGRNNRPVQPIGTRVVQLDSSVKR